MFTDNHSALVAALLLPGIYFICQAVALVMRLTLGQGPNAGWQIGVVIAALLYTLVLSANVTSLEHTFSRVPVEEPKLSSGGMSTPALTDEEELLIALTQQPTDCGLSLKPGWDALPKFKKPRNTDLKGKKHDLIIQPVRIPPPLKAG
jgi:hypothetical protein